jgi:hypothetical protein
MNCTLKVNMILTDGKHYPRGSVVDRESIALHLRSSNYIEDGVTTINRVMPIDEIEIEDTEEEEEKAVSPMRELTLAEVEPQEEPELEPESQRSKIVRRRLKRKSV